MKKDNAIIEFLGWIARPLDWPKAVYQDLKHWYVMRNVCKDEGVKKLFEKNKPEIRHDNIYRLYTVVNIPEELYGKQFAGARETYLIDELRKVEELTLRLGISEILYPEYNIITDVPDSFAYLLTLETDKDSLSIWQFLLWLFKLGLWTIIILTINAIVINLSGNSIIGWITSLFV